MSEVGTSHREVCSGQLYKWLVAAGLAWLEHNVEHVNQLNVFPVPDGDTGTNMHLTLRKAYDEVSKIEDSVDVSADAAAAAVARGALMGARGNSGVILSQILKGFADGIDGIEAFTVEQMANASKVAVDYAYKAVVDPVEGTILTVCRESVDGLVAALEKDPAMTLRDALVALVDSAHVSLDHTPELLPVLKDAGVVDSGGAGYHYFLEGMLRFLRGEQVTELEKTEQQATTEGWEDALVPEDEEGYGYDVQFLIHGIDMDVMRVRNDIDAMGWSTLVVGDPSLIKVHVHVHNPAEPINYAIGTLGAEIDDVVVENMQLQYKDYVADRKQRETGLVNEVEGIAVVTVVAGDGLHAIFEKDLCASYIIHGGQTMNPSTEDFVAAIGALPNHDVILLPNNKNIRMAAEQAAAIVVDKNVQVVPSRTVQQGISAMVAYMNATANTNIDVLVEEMRDMMADVRSADITTATRSVSLDGVDVAEGQIIGLLDGKLVTSGDSIEQVVRNILQRAHAADDAELVTVYFGDTETPESAVALIDALSDEFDELEFEIVAGGQPLYPYLISIE